jgi:hypothetical protein
MLGWNTESTTDTGRLRGIVDSTLDITDVPTSGVANVVWAASVAAVVLCVMGLFAAAFFADRPASNKVGATNKRRSVWLSLAVAGVFALAAVGAVAQASSLDRDRDKHVEAMVSKTFHGLDTTVAQRDCISGLADGHSEDGVCRVSFKDADTVVTVKFRRLGDRLIATHGSTEKIF